jgi:hypothetical protein
MDAGAVAAAGLVERHCTAAAARALRGNLATGCDRVGTVRQGTLPLAPGSIARKDDGTRFASASFRMAAQDTVSMCRSIKKINSEDQDFSIEH